MIDEMMRIACDPLELKNYATCGTTQNWEQLTKNEQSTFRLSRKILTANYS